MKKTIYLLALTSNLAMAETPHVANTVILPTSNEGVQAVFDYSRVYSYSQGWIPTPGPSAELVKDCKHAADVLVSHNSKANSVIATKVSYLGRTETSSDNGFGQIETRIDALHACSLYLNNSSNNFEVQYIGKMSWNNALKTARDLYKDSDVIAVGAEMPASNSLFQSTKLFAIKIKH